MLEKLKCLNPYPLVLITLISCIGFILLYSAAGGSFMPWALKQMIRFAVGMGLLFLIALTNIRFYFRSAYVRSLHNVASMYYNGEGVKQDYSKSLKWFTAASKKGSLMQRAIRRN